MHSDVPDYPITRRERLAFALVLCVCLGVMATCVACGPGLPPVRSPQEQHIASVAIRTTCKESDGSEKHYMGSGVLVSGHRILTAQHVINCEDDGAKVTSIVVDPGDGVSRMAAVEITLPAMDIARLYVELDLSDYFVPVSIGPRPTIGEKACQATAIPLWTYRCGTVQPKSGDQIIVNFYVEFGNSGSGVYSGGRLVGLTDTAWECQGGFHCQAGVVPLADYPWLIP